MLRWLNEVTGGSSEYTTMDRVGLTIIVGCITLAMSAIVVLILGVVGIIH